MRILAALACIFLGLLFIDRAITFLVVKELLDLDHVFSFFLTVRVLCAIAFLVLGFYCGILLLFLVM